MKVFDDKDLFKKSVEYAMNPPMLTKPKSQMRFKEVNENNKEGIKVSQKNFLQKLQKATENELIKEDNSVKIFRKSGFSVKFKDGPLPEENKEEGFENDTLNSQNLFLAHSFLETKYEEKLFESDNGLDRYFFFK